MSPKKHQGKTPIERKTLTSVLIVLAGVALLALYFKPATQRSRTVPGSRFSATQADVLRSAEIQRRALAEAQIRFILDEGDHVLETLHHVLSELKLWDEQVQPLLHNDDGRLIAGNTDRAERFAALYKQERPEPSHVERQRARVESLLAPLRKSLHGKAAAAKPDDAITEQLHNEMKLAKQHLTLLQDGRKVAAALLADARGAGDSPAAITLEQKVADIDARYATARADELARAREEAEKENRRKMAELERRKLADLARAERDRREAELEAQREHEETQTRLAREKNARDRLMTLARSPEVQARYRPFLARGNYSFAQQVIVNGPPFPPSYNALKRIGIMDDPELFFKAAIGATAYRRSSRTAWSFHYNDRPLWSKNPRTEGDWEELRQRYLEFRKLAPLWRDMGLLRP